MRSFPDIFPRYSIIKLKGEPFSVRDMQGLDKPFGEKYYSAEYDTRKGPELRKSVENYRYLKGKARIHGINCLEFRETAGLWDADLPHEIVEFFVVNDTHLKIIAAMEECRGVNELLTFKDANFHKHWAVGENNCGFEIELRPKRLIRCDEDDRLSIENEKSGEYDLVDKCLIRLGEREYETMREIYIGDDGQVSELYFTRNGKEVLRRYFVPDRWGYDDSTNKPYTERWPWVETLYLNNEKKVCTTVIVPENVL